MGGWKINYFFSWLTSVAINGFKTPARYRFRNILVIRLDEIGDMVTSLPVFDALRNKFPDAQITAWVTPLTAPLLRAYESLDAVVLAPPPQAVRFDLIVDLRGNFRTMWFALVRRPVIRLDRGTVRFRNKFMRRQHPHEVYTNLQVVEPVTGKPGGIPVVRLPFGTDNRARAAAYLNDNGIGNFVVFHPGARKVLRRWPAERFARLGSRLHEERGLDIVLAGVPDELPDLTALQGLMPFRTHLFCGYSLLDFAALAARASLFVGNESGPMHLAAAMQIPVIGLFGPGEPHVFAPFGEKSAFLHHKLECNPCGQVVCKYPENTCMSRITAEEVMDKIKELQG